MKKKRLQKVISLAACMAMITTMGSIPVAAEEVFEAAAEEDAGSTVQEVPAEPGTEEGFQDVDDDEEQLLQEVQEGNEDGDLLFGDGAVEEFSSGEAVTDLQYGSLTKVYLDPLNGSDENNGETSDKAVKSFTQAASLLSGEARGTIYLKHKLNLDDGSSHEWKNLDIQPADDFANSTGASSCLVEISTGTSLTLEGVHINNKKESGASWTGGNLICKYGSGTLTINEGTELECDANVFQAIYASDNQRTYPVININGGEIKGAARTSYEDKLALVAVVNGTFTMNGGTISGNTSFDGGGVYLSRTTFNMNGGRITGNTARRGGGIYAVGNSKVTLSGGSIDNNRAGDGGGIYSWFGTIKMDTEDLNGQPCVIENNTAAAEHDNDVYGQGGGIYLGAMSNPESVILGRGIIRGNKALEESVYNEEYDYYDTYGGQGGGVYAWNSRIDLTAAQILNNQTNAGGGIYTESTDVKQVLNMTGGEIRGNEVDGKGAGIQATMYYPDGYVDGHEDMDVKISGGKISGNLQGENEEENAVTLEMICWDDYDENANYPRLYLSGTPEIGGTVVLMDDSGYGPRVVVDGAFTPAKPIVMEGIYCTDDSIAVEWLTGLTPNESIFTVNKGFGAELKLDGQTLKWTRRVRVIFMWTGENESGYYSSNTTLFIRPGKKVDSSDIPVPAEIPGYTFTGWVDRNSGQDWTPDMEITEATTLVEQRKLNEPSVTLTADMENSCFAAPVTLTATASHAVNSPVFTYQWYKDGVLMDDQTEAVCTVTEPGEYKVVVTVKKNTRTATKEETIIITKKDHEFTWKSDEKTHWQICTIGGESTEAKAHEFGEWKVSKAAAVAVPGEEERICTVCGYKETRAIAALPTPIPTPTVVPPAPTEAPAAQAPVHLTKLTSKKTSVTVKWNKIKGASGYKIYGSKCGQDYKLLKTVKGTVTKWTHKDLRENTYYKYYVVAYKNVNGKQTVLSKTPSMHIATTGGKFSHVSAVNVKKASFTLKKGKKATIKASVVNTDGKIAKHVAEVRYMSSNKKVAVVNSKGVITAKGKGKCTIYCYAQDGVRRDVAVTVK